MSFELNVVSNTPLTPLTDLEEVWGERPMALVRELTKVHEQVLRGSAREVRAALREDQKRGEMVLVLGGRTRAERAADA